MFHKTKYIPLPQGEHRMTAKTGENQCAACARFFIGDELEDNCRVCPACGHHFPLTAGERLDMLGVKESFREFDAHLTSCNVLNFPGYQEKLDQATRSSGLREAIVTGEALIGNHPVVLGIMDSRFMMGSMGAVVGEKVCRAVEQAIDSRIPLLLFIASGGARMQEGMLSLMQMAKTSAAINKLHASGILYVAVLTHPTTGGVSASFASLADITLAEPGALIGFTGPRVIQQTLGQKLPERFQRAEFLWERGMIDMVVDRRDLQNKLLQILRLHQGGQDG